MQFLRKLLILAFLAGFAHASPIVGLDLLVVKVDEIGESRTSPATLEALACLETLKEENVPVLETISEST
jgi:hypothetical protein